jgi:hypothetical protein
MKPLAYPCGLPFTPKPIMEVVESTLAGGTALYVVALPRKGERFETMESLGLFFELKR